MDGVSTWTHRVGGCCCCWRMAHCGFLLRDMGRGLAAPESWIKQTEAGRQGAVTRDQAIEAAGCCCKAPREPSRLSAETGLI